MPNAQKSKEKVSANYYLGAVLVQAMVFVASKPEVDVSPSKLAARILKKGLEKDYGFVFELKRKR